MSTCADTTVRNAHGLSLDVWDGEIFKDIQRDRRAGRRTTAAQGH